MGQHTCMGGGYQKIERLGRWHPTQQAAVGKQQETEHVAADLESKGNSLNPENGGAGTKGYKVGKLESQGHVSRRSWGEQIAELTSAPLLVPRAGGQGVGAGLPSSFLPEAIPDLYGTTFEKDLILLAQTIHLH